MELPKKEKAASSPIFKKIKRIFITILVLLLLGGIGVGAVATFGCYSEGERTGSVQKFSKKGYVFKTWEGELLLREFGTQQSTVWTFSVQNEEVAKSLEQAMSKGEKVMLHYCQKYYTFAWQGETEYFVDRLSVVKP